MSKDVGMNKIYGNKHVVYIYNIGVRIKYGLRLNRCKGGWVWML